jgi:hypothetical protein
MNQSWLFIFGPQRSGTTLVAWLLSLHPDCKIENETHLARDLWTLLGLPPNTELRWNGEGGDVKYPLLMGRLSEDESREEIVRRMCEGLAAGYPARVVGSKSPEYSAYWRILRAIFPKCRFIITSRDHQATVDSLVRQKWWTGTREEADVHVSRYETVAAEAIGHNALLVRLEELERNPEVVLHDMIEWLGLEPRIYPIDLAVDQIMLCGGRKKIA